MAMTMLIFVSGLVTMGFLTVSLFFLRFWRRTGDGFFALFAAAFLLFAVNQALVALTGVPREEQSWFYLLRLAGFVLIIVAIVAKNLRSGSWR